MRVFLYVEEVMSREMLLTEAIPFHYTESIRRTNAAT